MRRSPTPGTIFTSAVAPGSESRRPQQTVAPLHAVLRDGGSVAYDERFTKPETDALMSEVMTRHGTVLVAWEHSKIPACVAALPDAPPVPSEWPNDRPLSAPPMLRSGLSVAGEQALRDLSERPSAAAKERDRGVPGRLLP